MRGTHPIIALFMLATALLASLPARAELDPDRYGLLMEPAQVGRLSYDDKRLLQLALAFENRYLGLIDGDWGAGSQRALARYARVEFDAPPRNIHMAALFFGIASRIVESGWDVIYLDNYVISLLFPLDAYTRDANSGQFENWSHSKSSVAIAAGRSTRGEMTGFHRYGLEQAARAQPYTVRRDTRWITSVEGDERLIYMRSDLVGGAWSTIIVSAARRDRGILNAIAASLAPGRGDAIRVSDSGFLDRIVTLFLEIADEDTDPRPAAPDPGQSVARPDRSTTSSGTGFVVNDRGDVMTNAHVVDGCDDILVDGDPATRVAESEIFDLAILRAEAKAGGAHARFASAPAQLNSDVLAAGFPLSNMLDGLNVTRGVVSSLKGIRGDSFNMQISAAVQPGNSGGPLLDSAGLVVGVVVAKLRHDLVQEATGAIPENVNFAVRGEIAKLFLAQNSIPIVIGTPGPAPSAVELGALASGITVYVECR